MRYTVKTGPENVNLVMANVVKLLIKSLLAAVADVCFT